VKASFCKNGETLSNKPNYKDAILKSLPADIMKKKSNFYENGEFIDGTLKKWFEAAIASIGNNKIKSSEINEAEDPLTSTHASDF
jgi:hypothetical protein